MNGFAALYHAHQASFPDESAESRYSDRLARAYPIHPELFRLFADIWATGANETFQQTRGVLRLMAGVVHALWDSKDDGALIMPGSLPLSDPLVRAIALQPVDPRFAAILDSEVEGATARPQAIEIAAEDLRHGARCYAGGARGIRGHGAAAGPDRRRRDGCPPAPSLRATG